MELEQVTVSPELQHHAALANLVESRRGVLAEGITLATARADWAYRQDERRRDVLVLRVRDPLGAEAQAEFAPEEVANENVLRMRLYDLNGAAIQVFAWRRRLATLYGDVRKWVARMAPPPAVSEETRVVDERRSGPYEAAALRIALPAGAACLEPIARWVVGADGRVDLVGDEGREILVLDERSGWSWVSNQPVRRLMQLTPEIFLELLDSVVR